MNPLSIGQAEELAKSHGLPFWFVLLVGSIVPLAVAYLGYLGKSAPARDDTGRAATSLIASLQLELDRMQRLLGELQPQIDVLVRARIVLLNVVSEFLGAAIAGRAMVHDLERQLGRPETLFPPLPTIPLQASEALAVPIKPAAPPTGPPA